MYFNNYYMVYSLLDYFIFKTGMENPCQEL